MSRRSSAVAALSAFLLACAEPAPREPAWSRVAENVWRSPGTPAAYALVDGDGALLFGAPLGADPSELGYAGITKIEGAFLTHAHRDTAAGAAAWTLAGIPVMAPRAAAPWITPEGVQRFWRAFLPASTSPLQAGANERLCDAFDYLVLPEGLPGVDCAVVPGLPLSWRGWTITPVDTPGHARAHVAYAARRKGDGDSRPLVFSGDAVAADGALWSPYTTDWDPAGAEGLSAAAASLKTLAALDPAALFPEHGPAVTEAPAAFLAKAAGAVAEAAFLKSYERFTKERLGAPPVVRLFDKTQLDSDGRRPWTRLSDSLYFTGNTYAIASKRQGLCLVDPAGEHLAAQIVRAQTQRIGRDVELALLTHPHADHYGSLAQVPGRDVPEVWALDLVSSVVTDPLYRRSPHAHPRPARVERVLPDGGRADWRNITFTFRALPAHGANGSAIFARIDGKNVAFVGDTFFHPDHAGGSGGWSGFDGGLPLGFAAAAETILEESPDWILASRGGAFEFVAADFERRVAWAKAAAAACDRLSPSGDHRLDWNPGLLRVEPFIRRAAPGQDLSVELVAANPSPRPQTLAVELAGRGILDDLRRVVSIEPSSSARLVLPLRVLDTARPGAHVFPLRVLAGDVERGDDAIFAVDVER